jgi:16S rRNA U1498 N3-methylase RsmE
MFIVVRNPMYRLIALGVSVAIFAILYFAVIKPNNDTANNAVRQGEQQLQQAVQNANKQSGGAVPRNVTNLTSCLAAAGTDTGKIQACTVKFQK